MFPFKKKKKEDEEEEEEEGKIKNPTSKKQKKKEPPKPWGKKERKLVFIVLFATILISGMLAASARSWKLPGFPRIKFPTTSLLETKTIVLTKDVGEIDPKLVDSSEAIKDKFNELTNDLSGVYGIYVIDLESGYSYALSNDEVYEAASLIKLPAMVAMFRQAEERNIDLDDEYVLKQEDKIGGSGSLYSKPAGTVLTYRELVELMGKESDNTAFGISRSILGDELIQDTAREIGMVNTSLETNETTLSDVGLFFEKLWSGNLVSAGHRKDLIDYLIDTAYEEWLTAGVGDGVKVSHKYGREVHVVNDAGIVFTDNPYVVVILTKGVVEREADNIFPDLSRVVYEGQSE